MRPWFPIVFALLLSALPICAQVATTASTTQPAAQAAESLTVVDRVASTGGAEVIRLTNGMTVILKPYRASPVVTVQAFVRAGSLYEPPWLGCGLSHLLEHLVAQGAEHEMGDKATAEEARQASDRVKEIGGQSNAYTSMDHTAYYISATAGKTMDCVDLVADWIARPQIGLTDFQREHGVVQREREMGQDDPGRQLRYADAENIFGKHPAAVPVIGYKEPLRRVTYEDVLAYHARMYIPQNVVLVVAGDIDTAATLARICRAFAGFSRVRETELTLPEVPPFAGVRRLTREHASLKDTMQRMSFQTIPLVHEDLYALDVLSYVLSNGDSSRLVQTIQRRKKLVTEIDSESWTPSWGRGVFTVAFRSDSDKADAAERAILEQLRSVVAEGVGAEELARAKRQKISDFVSAQLTVDSQAGTLAGDYLSTGDVDFSRLYTERIQAVTAEQVQQAARKYLQFERMAITRLTPPAAQTTTAATTQPQESGAAQLLTLPNGLRVVLQSLNGHQDGQVGMVSMALAASGGLLLEKPQTNGLGTAMTSLSTHGAGNLTAEQIAQFFDDAGGAITGQCGSNSFYWQANVLSDRFDRAMEVFADVVLRPTFPADELDKLRPVLLANIQQVDEQWSSQLQKYSRHEFFGDTPYGLMVSGRKEVIETVTPQQIAAYHRDNLRAGSSVLAIVGRFDAQAAAKKVQKLFAEMPAGEIRPQIAPARTVPPGVESHVLKTTNQVAGIIVAAPSMPVTDLKDRLPLTVLDTIISGYQLPSGWLHNELRGKQLVYVVHAYNFSGLAPGAFVTYAACQPDKAQQVIQIIRKDLDKAAQYTPTQEEIDLAVNTILTAELLDNQSPQALSLGSALDELYGFGYDFRKRLESLYRLVTPQDVHRVGARYLGHGYVLTVTTPQPELIEKK